MERSMLVNQDCTIQLSVITPEGRKWGLQCPHRFIHPKLASTMASLLMDAITNRLSAEGYTFLFTTSGVTAEEVPGPWDVDFMDHDEN